MNRPTLHVRTLNAPSWALRTWLALKTAGCEFDEVLVGIRRLQRFKDVAQLAALSPAAWPIPGTGRIVIFDSTAIMEFANKLAVKCEVRCEPVLSAPIL